MDKRRIPDEELIFSYARSSGPGGQNVNKVNSKAVLKWHIATSRNSDLFKERFTEMFKGSITRAGYIVLMSERFRSQEQNIAECIRKLENMAALAMKPVKKRKPTKIPRGVTEGRLEQKRKVSQRKKGRKPSASDW